jgi:hypothetical protein
MEPPDRISERAIALAAGDNRDAAINELIRLADDDPGPLQAARQLLVERLSTNSNDFAATAGLNLINAALASVGWADPVAWKPRVWRISRKWRQTS